MKKVFLFFIGFFIFCSVAYAQDKYVDELSSAIRQFVVNKLGTSQGQIQVVIKSTGIKDNEDLGELVDLKIIDFNLIPKPLGNMIFPIDITTKKLTKRIFTRVRVEQLLSVITAKQPLKRGSIITINDLEMKEKDVALMPQKYFTAIEQIISSEAASSIPKGSIIFNWMIKEIPLIQQGEEVMIYVVAEGIQIKSKGVLLEDGYLGKTVKVRVKDSKKILEGEVLSASIVEVKL